MLDPKEILTHVKETLIEMKSSNPLEGPQGKYIDYLLCSIENIDQSEALNEQMNSLVNKILTSAESTQVDTSLNESHAGLHTSAYNT